jgi:hypothetical protein
MKEKGGEMIKTVVTTRRELFYVALVLGAPLTWLSLEFSNPLGVFLGVLVTLRAVQVLGEASTVPMVISLFIAHALREIMSSDVPGVKWWVYLALGIAALVRDWRNQRLS